jgi:hypothetical protein
MSPGIGSTRVQLEQPRYRLGRSSVNELAFPADEKLSRERPQEGWTGRIAFIFCRVDPDHAPYPG